MRIVVFFENVYKVYKVYKVYGLGDGIVAGTTPGMASQDTLDAQPTAFEDAVFEDRLHHVLTASRRVAAGGRGKRRDKDPVKVNRDEENFSNESFPLLIAHW